MAIILTDPNTAGPFATFQLKDVQARVIKLAFGVFATAGTDQVVARLPADCTILRMETWVRTALTGNSVSAPTIAVGTTSGGTDLAATFSVTNTAGTHQTVSPATGVMQVYNIPYSSDINLWVHGSCSTGNATAGEIDLIVYFVR
jgi:hypothetical protein